MISKSLNTEMGHPQVDERVLKPLGAALRGAIRHEESAGREPDLAEYYHESRKNDQDGAEAGRWVAMSL